MGSCFGLNLLIRDKATPSADKTQSDCPSGASLGRFKTSEFVYKDANDKLLESAIFDADSISKSSISDGNSCSVSEFFGVERGVKVTAEI